MISRILVQNNNLISHTINIKDLALICIYRDSIFSIIEHIFLSILLLDFQLLFCCSSISRLLRCWEGHLGLVLTWDFGLRVIPIEFEELETNFSSKYQDKFFPNYLNLFAEYTNIWMVDFGIKNNLRWRHRIILRK